MSVDISQPNAIPAASNKEAVAHSNPRVQSGARWFWWIAGLSIVNSVVLLSGGTFNFILGLAVTQLADSVFHNVKIVALVFDLLVVGFFFGAGYFAKKGHLWAFVVGAIAYLGDGVIFALFSQWVAVAFHAYALFMIYNGWNLLRQDLARAKEEALKVPEATAIPSTPANSPSAPPELPSAPIPVEPPKQ